MDRDEKILLAFLALLFGCFGGAAGWRYTHMKFEARLEALQTVCIANALVEK